MLQVAAQEFLCRQSHGFPLVGVGILIAERHLAVAQGEEAIIGNGDPVDVAPQVTKHFLCSVKGRCNVPTSAMKMVAFCPAYLQGAG